METSKLIQSKTMTLRDIAYIITLIVGGVVTYMITSNTADKAYGMALENKAFGITRDEKIDHNREYNRDYSYRKSAEVLKETKKNEDSIHAIREEMVETRVKLSHIEKNQEKTIENQEKTNQFLQQLIDKK